MRVALLLLLAASVATPAQAATQDAAPLPCGQVEAANGEAVDVMISGAKSCGTSLKVMQTYFKRALEGKCQGSGCHAKVRGYRCSAPSAAGYEETGIAATCKKGRRVVTAQRPAS